MQHAEGLPLFFFGGVDEWTCFNKCLTGNPFNTIQYSFKNYSIKRQKTMFRSIFVQRLFKWPL